MSDYTELYYVGANCEIYRYHINELGAVTWCECEETFKRTDTIKGLSDETTAIQVAAELQRGRE